MIIVRFTSGLGNQMFQYNLYSMLRDRFPNTKVKADLSWFARFSEHQGYELSRIFGKNTDFYIDAAGTGEIIRCFGRIPNRIKGPLGDAWQFVLRVPHRLIRTFSRHERCRIEQTGLEDNELILSQLRALDPEKDYYITGFFIEEVYFRDRLSFLHRAFAFDEDYGERNARYAADIRNSQSVSIHIRRGDYLSKQYSDSFIALGEDYYKKAVSLAMEQFDAPVFYVFSDDKDFARSALSFIDNKVLVEGNTGRNSYRDMQLMSMCRANIIANSTFSVWGALLNAHDGAMVYYPAAYMRQKDTQEMTLPGWVRI